LEGFHNQRKACDKEMQTPKEELQPLNQELGTINLHLQEFCKKILYSQDAFSTMISEEK
jgi:hypothetical protein